MWEPPHATVTHLVPLIEVINMTLPLLPNHTILPSRDLRSKQHSVSVDAYCLKPHTDQTKKNPSTVIRCAELKKT